MTRSLNAGNKYKNAILYIRSASHVLRRVSFLQLMVAVGVRFLVKHRILNADFRSQIYLKNMDIEVVEVFVGLLRIFVANFFFL